MGWSIDKMNQLFARVKPGKAYYPGSEQKIREAIQTYKNAYIFGDFSEGHTPWVFAPNLNAEDNPACFHQEIFASFYAGTALAAKDIADFMTQAVEFCNHQLWGTLGVMIVIHPESLKSPEIKAAFDRALATLRYGTIGVNINPVTGYSLRRLAWGGYPGSTYANVQSGIGFVNNTLMFDKIQKSVVYGPFYSSRKPLYFPTAKNKIKMAKALLNYQKSPSWWNIWRLIRSARS